MAIGGGAQKSPRKNAGRLFKSFLLEPINVDSQI